MLGKSTRWLRILGHDVIYSNTLNDEELIETAEEERRILLTSDLDLYKHASRRGMITFLVKGETETEKLANLAKRFDIKLEIDLAVSRCSKCNERIRTVQKKDVVKRVPTRTFHSYIKFWECPGCKQMYWQGAHWKRIDETLKEVKQKLKDKG
jgi:hypothetical protein